MSCFAARHPATLNGKLAHTSIIKQQATCTAVTSVTGTKPFIPLPYLHDLNHIWKSLASFHLFIWLQMNAFEPNTGFLNKQNVQLGSDVFVVAQVMHHLCKCFFECIEVETTAVFIGHYIIYSQPLLFK